MTVLFVISYQGVQSKEYECGTIKQPHFHNYKGGKDFLGHFKIRNDEYKMHNDVNRREDQCCNAMVEINKARKSKTLLAIYAIMAIYDCLWNLWENKYCTTWNTQAWKDKCNEKSRRNEL